MSSVTDNELLVVDLLNDLVGVTRLLRRALRCGGWLDVYLVAAGINQIVVDYLHPDPFLLRRVASQLAHLPPPVGGILAAAVRTLAAAISGIRALGSESRGLLRWQQEFDAFVLELAARTMRETDGGTVPEDDLGISREAERLLAPIETWSAELRGSIVRLPACFRGFDQQPADVDQLVRKFAAEWPDRERQQLVVGLRTSGSYLAPLAGACLAQLGYRNVQVMTLRPGRSLLDFERKQLRQLVASNGMVLLVDDPPASGESVEAAATALMRLGVPRQSIVLLLAVFGSALTLPPRLRPFKSVVLPWSDWAVQQQLRPLAVQSTLSRLLGPAAHVSSVERSGPPDDGGERRHVRGLFRACVQSGSQAPRDVQVYVRGVGVGYLGRQSMAVSNQLGEHVPAVYGVANGLIYREWLSEPWQPAQADANTVAPRVAAYIADRARRLRANQDWSVRRSGQFPAWEVASMVLSRAFGRFAMAARLPLTNPIARRLLRVQRPSVVDGHTSLDRWWTDESVSPGRVRKTGWEDGVFHSGLELTAYDPVADLAGVAPGARQPELQIGLRTSYERLTGEPISEERWLLHQLVHLWNQQRAPATVDAARRASSRAVQRYLAAQLLMGVTPPIRGQLCALDVDGVLETDVLGCSATTPAGARALRGLVRHGYSVVLATGRCLDEVRERCEIFPLSGGVAEYGAAAYNHASGRSWSLLRATELQNLEALRTCLRGIQHAHLDPDFAYSVRAYRLDARGCRRALAPHTIQSALRETGLGDEIRALAGDSQTDFVVARIDKGLGLIELARDLGQDIVGPSGEPLALAVGDSRTDLPMLRLARLARAPRNAHPELARAGVQLTRRPYQAGLAAAVTDLLGHAPSTCSVCRLEHELAPETRLFMRLLAIRESSAWDSLAGTISTFARMWLG